MESKQKVKPKETEKGVTVVKRWRVGSVGRGGKRYILSGMRLVTLRIYIRGTVVVAMHCDNIVLTCAENRP